MPLGVYISVPFCRSKCSFCNFASGVFPPERMARYIELVDADIRQARSIVERLTGQLAEVDSVYLGGGTPSLLPTPCIRQLFETLRVQFSISPQSEITVECAPNSLSDESLAAYVDCGVNRISFGAQSFNDRETSSVARLHKAADTIRDIQRVQRSGIENVSIDLIAGLPHQTLESWDDSLSCLIDLGVPHASIYMLEIDEDSRLGRELIAGGTRYHAHTVPDEDLVVRLYERAIERLEHAGVPQYEISNFARPSFESRHNLKYWQRLPYFGFGADAHSMLVSSDPQFQDIRFATQEELADFETAADHYSRPLQRLTTDDALEEAVILGLRLNRGLDLNQLKESYGRDARVCFADQIAELTAAGLLLHSADALKLTDRGRLISNEVFERFLHASSRA